MTTVGRGQRLLLASALWLAACGDPDKDTEPAPSPAPDGSGFLWIYEIDDPGLMFIGPEYADGLGYSGGARFWRGEAPACPLAPGDYGCVAPAACEMPASDEVEDVTAGNVTVGPVTLPAPDYDVGAPGLPWAEGESIAIVAEGDDAGVPAFHATLNGPAFVTLVSPPPGSVQVAGTTPLELAWSSEGYGDVVLSIGSLDGVGIQCRWPGADGGGVVPGELLDALEPSSDGTSHTANLNGLAEAEIAAGSFRVLASLMTNSSASNFLLDVR
jgi:hypothetical protein